MGKVTDKGMRAALAKVKGTAPAWVKARASLRPEGTVAKAKRTIRDYAKTYKGKYDSLLEALDTEKKK